MNLAVAATVFGLVVPAELPDETFVAWAAGPSRAWSRSPCCAGSPGWPSPSSP
jgi:hypothetical protein